MTPAARLSAAMAVLERILAGDPAEQALTNWGRASRFAGSGDRHAVRDLVYDALRCKRSFAALGGGMTGRGLVLGGLRARGEDPEPLFTGQGHAPAALGAADMARPPEGAEALDVPDWTYPLFSAALGDDLEKTLEKMRQRAPVFLRVNAARTSRAVAMQALAAEGIETQPVSYLNFGLEVIGNARKIQNSKPYADGRVELQDASSQAVVEALPLADGQKVLDYCAGGGGKTLAMAARARLTLFAHDAAPGRMRDLLARADRAKCRVKTLDNPAKSAPYDVILTDVPCSGSGSWRRDPMGKWQLTPERLVALRKVQAEIIDQAAKLVAPAGVLAYATCSMFREENEDQVTDFIARNQGWQVRSQRRFSPLCEGDGFFLAVLERSAK